MNKPLNESEFLDRSRFPVDPWALIEARYSDADLGTTETLFSVGNGYLGMRGNVEEGRDSFAHGTFLNGFHETWPIQHAEEAFGFARVGQTIVNAPDAKLIRLYVDDEPLLLSVADLHEYERRMDFRTGIYSRELVWRTPGGKRVRISSTRMVSLTERHLAAMTFEVTLLDAAAPVAISSQILNRQDGEDEYHVPDKAMGEGVEDPRRANRMDRRVLEPILHRGDEPTPRPAGDSVPAGGAPTRVELGFRCVGSGMTLAVAADHHFVTANPYEQIVRTDDDLAKVVYRVEAEPNVPISLTKVVTYHTSRGVPPRELIDRCSRTLDRANAHGIDRLRVDQADWLEKFWARSDVIVEDDQLQQALRWNLFQVAQASARAEGAGIPAKGVTGSGYGGHYFWDTEIYVLPFLTYTRPAATRAALRFRYQLLDAARRRAAEVSQHGALFPWRTINGEEASAYYAAGTAQYHINADIVHALAQYVAATGDRDFMMREGIDIVVETARMWADLGFWLDDEFHIHGVTGPDEYTTVVNDNLFTNVMARFNLDYAAKSVRELAEIDGPEYAALVDRLGLEDTEVEEWERAAEGMAIPFDEHLGVHPQDLHFLEREVWDLEHTPQDKRPLLLHFHPLVIYRFQVLKQADVVLALFLQGELFTREEKLADFEYYDPITTGDSTLSAVVQSIMASEVGYSELALKYFLNAAFVDLADLHHNTPDGVHVASAGGVWSSLIYGFAGFRDHGGKYTFDPRLPEQWPSLTFRLELRGSRIKVVVRQSDIEFVVEAGDGVTIEVRGKQIDLAGTTTVPLDGQGPRIEGEPAPVAGRERADGSVIGAIVPGTREAITELAQQTHGS
jgi:alpha,alpha-trehalose phosphorylase